MTDDLDPGLWLAEQLRDGPRPVDELRRDADAAGIDTDALDRARAGLDVLAWDDEAGRELWAFPWSGAPIEAFTDELERLRRERRSENVGGWEHAGEITVNSGHLVLADPCDLSTPTTLERAWADATVDPYAVACDEDTGLLHDLEDGRGFLVTTGFGDGGYPVHVRRTAEGLIAEVVVTFVDEHLDDHDDGDGSA